MDHDYLEGSESKSTSTDEHYDDESIGLGEAVPFADSTGRAKSRPVPEALHTTIRMEAFKRRANIAKRNVWLSISRYVPLENSAQDGGQGYYEYSLTVRLRFSGRVIIEKALVCSTAPTSGEYEEPLHIPGLALSTKTHLSFDRPWIDETQDFNMRAVLSTLRHPDREAKGLGPKFTWYIDAVPIDALLPPGIPLSAKEILAYYPHHARWRDIMLRLARNDYRGADILGIQAFFRGPPSSSISGPAMNMYQRDSIKKVLPSFRSDTFDTKHDRCLHTLHLSPGKYISDRCCGFTVPALEDLTRGLHHLPAGLDARCLTECLDWYLSWRDAFTPPLQLNVLHVQALSRAIRIPLRPFGPQNLDVNGLEEWKVKGRFEKRPVSRALIKSNANGMNGYEHAEAVKNRLEINLNLERVTLHFQLPIRHVLTFPFLALHGVVGEAIKLGISKAETRRMKRENTEKVETEAWEQS